MYNIVDFDDFMSYATFSLEYCWHRDMVDLVNNIRLWCISWKKFIKTYMYIFVDMVDLVDNISLWYFSRDKVFKDMYVYICA